MTDKIIDEVMGLVETLHEESKHLGSLDQLYGSGVNEDEQNLCKSQIEAIRAKLHEVLERKPMSEEDAYDLTHSAGPELVELGQKWADNEIHAYQYAHQAEAIVTKAVRDTERFHGIGT